MIFAPLVAAALVAQSVSVTAGVSTAAERPRFRFENPSTFSTTELVPHFFEQKYFPPTVSFFGELTYGELSRTRVSVRPRKQTRGSDIDTFFQPSGDVVTSGTDGPITFGGFAIEQQLALTTFRGWHIDGMLGYGRDRAEFLPDDRVVTHTQPPTVTRTFITDRETTIAQIMQAGATAHRDRVKEAWRARFEVGVQPVVASRLLIRLPDKYPGVDFLYSALGFGGGALWTLEHGGRRVRAGVTLSVSGARAYRNSATYATRRAGVDFFVGTGPG